MAFKIFCFLPLSLQLPPNNKLYHEAGFDNATYSYSDVIKSILKTNMDTCELLHFPSQGFPCFFIISLCETVPAGNKQNTCSFSMRL